MFPICCNLKPQLNPEGVLMLNKNNPEDVKMLNGLIVDACINGDDLNQHKSRIADSEDGLFEKCEQFVSDFSRMKKQGEQLSPEAVKALLLQGKQIWLTQETLSLLKDELITEATVPQDEPQTSEVPDETGTDQESASGLLTQPDRQDLEPSELLSSVLGLARKYKKWLIGLAAIALLFAYIIPQVKATIQKQEEEQRLESAIKGISLCSELSTVEYKVKLVHIEKDENKIIEFFNNITSIVGWNLDRERSIAIVSTATIKAGINLAEFSPNNVLAMGKTITVNLPKPKLFEHNITVDTCHLYVGSLRQSFDPKKIINAEQDLNIELGKYLRHCDILTVSQENTREFFEAFLKQLGYTSITINFI